MTRTYDQKCYDLAAAFLSDHPESNSEQNRYYGANATSRIFPLSHKLWTRPRTSQRDTFP